jgi:hypothetical protein
MRDGWSVPPGSLPTRKYEISRPKLKEKLTLLRQYVRMNSVQANRLQNALKQLGAAIHEAEAALEEMCGA